MPGQNRPGGTVPTSSTQPVGQGVALPTSAPAATSSSLAARYPTIVSAYQKYLGRMPTDAEIMSQTANGSFGMNDPRLALSANNIQNSQEALAFATSSQTPATGSSGTSTDTTTNNSGTQTLNQASFMQSIKGYPDTPDGLAKWVADHPEFGVTLVNGGKSGKIQLPDGSIVDVGIAFGAGGGRGWSWQTGDGGGGSAAVATSPSQPNVDPALRSAFMQKLIAMLGAQGQGLGLDNPTIAAQFNPQAQIMQRTADAQRASAAEAGYASGAGSGALAGQNQSILENRGLQQSSALGNLQGQQLDREIQQVQQALSIGAGLLTQDQQIALQMYLSKLQNDQFNSSYGLAGNCRFRTKAISGGRSFSPV